MVIDDKTLWKKAKARVAFRRHLYIYLAVNLLLWLIWFIPQMFLTTPMTFPWPIYPTFGWGIGLAFQAVSTYGCGEDVAIQREFEKLKKNDLPNALDDNEKPGDE